MSLFGKKTVDSITSKLSATVLELEVHAGEQLRKAETQKLIAAVAHAAHEAHVAEHQLALKVVGNIKGLLGQE